MKFETALTHYGTSRAIARVLDVTEQAVAQWKAKGKVPWYQALRLQEKTEGKLTVDASCYARPAKSVQPGAPGA